MAEIGLVASIVSIAGAGAQLSLSLYNIADAIGSAGIEARLIASEASLFSHCLTHFSKVLKPRDKDDDELHEVAHGVVKECRAVLRELRRLTKQLAPSKTKKAQQTKSPKFIERVRWLLRRPKVAFMRSSISSFQATLNLLIATIDYKDAEERKLPEQLKAPLRAEAETMMNTVTQAKQEMEDCADRVSAEPKPNPMAPGLPSPDLDGLPPLDSVSDSESDPDDPLSSKEPHEKASQASSALTKASNCLISVRDSVNIQHRVLSYASEMLGLPQPEPAKNRARKPIPPSQRPSTPSAWYSPTLDSYGSTKILEVPPSYPPHPAVVDPFPPSQERYRGHQPPRRPPNYNPFDVPPPNDGQRPQSWDDYPMPPPQGAPPVPTAEFGSMDEGLKQAQNLMSDLEGSLPRNGGHGQAGLTDTGRPGQHFPNPASDPLAILKDVQALLNQIHREQKQAKRRDKAESSKKAPNTYKTDTIEFNDAIGRKFTFPFESCKTWKGLGKLINQTFLHVDGGELNNHVSAGHYDLAGPDGAIVLPSVWEAVIQPGNQIWMHMWPLPPSGPQHTKATNDPFSSMGFDPLDPDPFGLGGMFPPPKDETGSKKKKEERNEKQKSDPAQPTAAGTPAANNDYEADLPPLRKTASEDQKKERARKSGSENKPSSKKPSRGYFSP